MTDDGLVRELGPPDLSDRRENDCVMILHLKIVPMASVVDLAGSMVVTVSFWNRLSN